MTARSRGAALIALVTSLIVAACQGGSEATTAPTAQPTAAPTVAPAASGVGGSFALPSGLNADRDLESLIPGDIAGAPIQKLSMTGDTFMGSGQGTAELRAMLAKVNKQPSDLSVAFGGNASATIVAFRIKGVEASLFYGAYLEAANVDNLANITDVTIAGKPAKKVVDTENRSTYIYFAGDALLTITPLGDGVPDDVLNEIFTKLP